MPLGFGLIWGVLTLIIVLVFTLPLVEFTLVCLIRGPAAYFHEGVRITHTKPAHFTTGELVPPLPSAIVSLGGVALTLIVVGVLLYRAVQFFKGFARGRDIS